MPLILISGYPASGKTTRTQQLISRLETTIASQPPTSPHSRLRIHHISEHSTLFLPRTVYATARAEKDARATFASAIKRHLARDVIVIADGMNYIKGFRYQLYCEAKAIPTPSCVVHVGTTAETCGAWNEGLLSAAAEAGEGLGEGYEREVFENLIFRYEEPNGMTRWDAPLFTVAEDDAEPDCAAIWEALVGSEAAGKVRPNAATVLKPAAEQGYLYELDRVTNEVVTRIVEWGRNHEGEGGGGEVNVGGEEGVDEAGSVQLPLEIPSLSRLQALRRQFIALNRQHTLSKARIRGLFVGYLNDAFEA